MYFVDEIPAVPDTNILNVNIESTTIKITVVINSKWQNLDYPRYLVGTPQVTFPVATKLYIPWVEFVFTTSRIGRLYHVPKSVFSGVRISSVSKMVSNIRQFRQYIHTIMFIGPCIIVIVEE